MKILQEAYKNFIQSMEDREFPDCFESKEQFEAWHEVEVIAHTKPRMFPCRDCTPEYRESVGASCAQAELQGVTRIMGKG